MGRWTAIVLLVLGCTKEDESAGTAATTDTGSAEDRWWESDEDAGEDEESDEESDDKPDDGDFGGLTVDFKTVVDLDAGTGTFDFKYDLGEGLCQIKGALVDLVDADGCLDCTIAKSMTLDSVTVLGDDCGTSSDWEGEVQTFGQGSTEVYEYEGTQYYTLYELDPEEGDDWEEVDGGYSTTDGSKWTFNMKL